MKYLKYILLNSKAVFIGSIIFIFLLTFSQLINIANAQAKKTLEDFGLTEESVKWLSQEEIDKILNSPTPEETKIKMEEERKEWEKLSTTTRENTPPPFLFVPSSGISSEIPGSENIVNCFDYYHFGSIQVDLFSDSTSAVSGMKMQFTGKVTNTNTYPIVGGTLYVKIMRQRSQEKEANGPDIVDQFIVIDNVSIQANKSVPLSFEWPVPLYSKEGDYTVATYFVTDKKFNLLGLSFTDDIIGNTFNFHINGTKSIIAFDKSSVSINKKSYFFATYPPRIDDKDSANIIANIYNTTNKDETVDVIWKLYKWDIMSPDNFIREMKKSYTIKSQYSLSIDIDIPDKEYPVYYLVGELKYEDTKSILGIRFVRNGVDRVRLNFPSITQYPIKKGEISTMFSCVHNSGTSGIVQDNKLIMRINDSSGKTIDEYTYEGPITGEMMAVKKDFKSPKDMNTFSLYTELWQAGKMVDQSNIVYSCSDIDPDNCNKDSSSILITSISILALILIALGFGIHRRRVNTITSTYILAILLFSAFILSPSVTEAKGASWNEEYTDTLSYYWDFSGYITNWGSGWANALGARNITVNYNAEIRNADTNALISDNSSIPVGTNLLLQFKPHRYTDISWFGTGYSADSPYGQWRQDAEPPPVPDGIQYGVPAVGVPIYSNTSFASFDWGLWCPNTATEESALTSTQLGEIYNRTNIFVPTAGKELPFFDSLTFRQRADLASFVNNNTYPFYGYNLEFGIYIPLVISPPTKTIINTSGMTCGAMSGNETDGYSMLCTVDTAGSMNPTFNFSSTFGKYYYRYFNYWYQPGYGFGDWGCHGNNIPLIGANDTVNIPVQTISYSLIATAVDPLNGPPATPTITGPIAGKAGTNYTFNIVSTDPDNDQIRYGIDWDSDSNIDQWLPIGGYINSGISQDTSKSWASGSQSFKVLAQDTNNLWSGWATHTIIIDIYELTTSPGGNSGCSTGDILVTWNKVAGVDHYILYRQTGSDPWITLDSNIPQPGSGTTVTYIDADLQSGNYKYKVEGVLTDTTHLAISDPIASFPVLDPNACVSCDDITFDKVPPITKSEDIRIFWTSTNAVNCILKESGTQINAGNTLPIGSELRSPGPDSTKTYTLICEDAEVPPNQCSPINSKVLLVTDSLRLWLNDTTGLDDIRVRPRQEFGLNWKGSELSNLIDKSCFGTVYDEDLNEIPFPGWDDIELDNDKVNSDAFPLSIENKGVYKFMVSCKTDPLNPVIRNSNHVKITVNQAKLEEI